MEKFNVLLVDDIQTSDDFILNALNDHTLFKIAYKTKPSVAEKLGFAASTTITTALNKLTTWSSARR